MVHFALFSLGLAPLYLPTLLQPSQEALLHRSIQTWGISTLRQQIHARHVAKVAFYADESAVEVLDSNGLQRRVAIFPGVAPILLQDLRSEKLPFFVVPERPQAPSVVLAFARGFVSMLVVILVINALGMLDQFVWGCMIAGSVLNAVSEQVASACGAAGAAAGARVAEGRKRHGEAVAGLYRALGALSAGGPAPVPPASGRPVRESLLVSVRPAARSRLAAGRLRRGANGARAEAEEARLPLVTSDEEAEEADDPLADYDI
ncbi:hypothetical protein EMIHUDRAFT_116035 [Emiliania huxleyi CCMP1516]|uniref:Uncharacterized protein n=2 Tax=Emiliania huxleyi TaxID=2903 RepID=A0A0D3JL71_EMIH1|nr:hypothetical protein EMIHUDRAFT_116035 [Emiliania huxleyi CCMP1516]EOD24256.1 hypothetical protein EMIHUDRAFT_116035 [Emiliania huxleyi CCMP1516]|eukprot:XP_005776685.1 hypothetical protein EMIHUDRAFT_116035 [Emiliania huxleyi CCMP1516]